MSIFDDPTFDQTLFFPRPDSGSEPPNAVDRFTEVSGGDRVHTRIHVEEGARMSLLFFHGNGEIVSDYDDLAGAWRQLGVELVVSDYRGYGKSSGRPRIRTILEDARAVVEDLRAEELLKPMVAVMGRSLGSLPAIDLAAAEPETAGLIIESGFADPVGLLRRRGLSVDLLEEEDDRQFNNERKMADVSCPVLVIHGEMDDLIPKAEGEALFRAAPGPKKLVVLPDVGHNDILWGAYDQYFAAVGGFIFDLGED